MNRSYLAFVAAGLLACLAGGCAWLDPPCDNGFSNNGPTAQGLSDNGANGAGRHAAAAADNSQSGVVAYPYYTNRGPRDYFSRPTDIGP